MADGIQSRLDRMRTELNRSTAFLNFKWPRRILTTLLVIVVLFGLFGFFAVPPILRHVLTTQVATSIDRPVTVGKIAFNPYRLRLDLDQLHIADRDPQKPFVDLGHLRVKVSWTSLFRLAPIVKELTIVHPAFHLVRTGDQQFNFSDLLVTRTPPPPPSKPQRFAVSNIRIQNGDIRFDDQVLNQSHAVERIELDVPFIANLPADTDIFVQPLLRMVVDGSPFLIGGRALPFLAEPESSIGVSINHFNLAPYMGYVPAKVPIKLPAGALSAFLQVHFVQTPAGPIIRVTGNTSLDDLDVRDSANAPLAGFKRATAVLDDVEPLGNVFHLGAIALDTLNVVLVRNRDGTTNLTALTAPSPAPPPSLSATGVSAPVAVSGPATSAPVQTPPAPPAAQAPASPAPLAPSPVPGAAQSSAVPAAPAPSQATNASPLPAASSPAAPAAPAISRLPSSVTAFATPSATSSAAASTAATTNTVANASPGPLAASTDASQDLSLSRERSARSASGEGTPRSTPSTAAFASPPATPAVAPTATQLSAPSIAASAPSAAPPPASPSAGKGPLDLSIASVTLTNGAVKLTDNSLATPATVALQNINVGLKQFAMGPKAGPAAYEFAGQLGGGGAIAVKGNLDLPQSQVTSDVTITQVDLPAFQAYAQSALAATLGAGKLNAHAGVVTSFAASKFNLHVEPADFSVDNLELNAPGGREKPVQWSRFGATIAQVDLASHNAVVKEVHADGIRLSVKRGRDGKLSLLSLLRSQNEPASTPPAPARSRARSRRRTPAPKPRMTVSHGRRAPVRRGRGAARAAAPAPPAPPAGPQWQYKVESIAIEKAEIDGEDDSASKPIKAVLAPVNLHVKNFTSDFHRPFDVDLDGVLNRRGNFRFNGPVVLAPLKATLHVNTRRLDLAFADALATKDLNATFKSAMLTTTGIASAATVRGKMHLGYRGDATIGNVRMLDKLTGDDFVRWNSLSFNRLDFALGEGKPQVHVGAIALSDFYARLILNANGRLNLSDITSNPAEARKSLTRQQTGAAAGPVPPMSSGATPTPTPSPTPVAANAGATPAAQPTPVPKPLPADIQLGKITLSGGHVDYSDFFIKPNYRANLTNISGKVGAFGTSSTTPADVLLEGQINGNAPINISGAINPLAPLAAVDIKAKADGIVLTDLSAYSVKYTGYPITKGSLTVDVHYVLANQNLTATNHIFLDQLTFGDRVESSTAKNLPIRLAVAILKDSKGQINLDVPVSGSLNDPQFSLGGIIFHAFMNILTKAITAPFRLLTSAIGGLAGGSAAANEDLSYVEFAPGRSTLSADSIKRLDAVAAALNARTALKLGITGRIDPATDKAGLHEAKVDDEVMARLKDSEGADAVKGQIPPDLYDKYLKKVYKAAKFQKPTDAIGLNKSLPPDEMKKLLVTHMEVSDDDLKKLADARAAAVRTYLGTKIDPSRITVAAPKLDAAGIDDQGKRSRADLTLQ